jgi:hypothetical protein
VINQSYASDGDSPARDSLNSAFSMNDASRMQNDRLQWPLAVLVIAALSLTGWLSAILAIRWTFGH